MNSFVLIVFASVSFILGYLFYGRYIARKLGIDPKRETPAHTMTDNVDYVPAKMPVLLGHHFASIAGAAPIIGPITAAVFGWVPVFLWIVLGSIFLGAVHDMTSQVASVRHKGQSVGKVIEAYMGERGKQLFLIFAWATLVLVIAAFTIVVSKTFVATPAVSTASILFIFLAIVFGFSVYRMKAGLAVSTVIGVILLLVCVWFGVKFPLAPSADTAQAQYIWSWILLAYIFVASVTPVWILLQPRDYLNSFLLYLVLIGAFVGLLFKHPDVQMPAFAAFVDPKLGSLFPILFVTVACGAISGFHSLVASGTTAKQLNSERDAKPVGYGAMLIEGTLAVIALLTAIILVKSDYVSHLAAKGPISVFSAGVGGFVAKLGVPLHVGITFAALAVSAFALTSLDTATRLGRFAFQEFFRTENPNAAQKVLTNRFVATFFTVLPGGILALSGSWTAIWPIFGAANQLLAALALLAGTVWLARKQKQNHFLRYPMYFMFAVTLSALVVLIYKKINLLMQYYSGQAMPQSFGVVSTYFLALIAVLLFIVAIVLVIEAYQHLKLSKEKA